MTPYLSDPVLLIIGTALGFLKYIMIFRLLFEVASVNFYNPLCQAVVKITNPIILPFSIISMRIAKFDIIIILLIIFIFGLEIIFPYLFQSIDFNIMHILIYAFGLFLKTVLNIYFCREDNINYHTFLGIKVIFPGRSCFVVWRGG